MTTRQRRKSMVRAERDVLVTQNEQLRSELVLYVHAVDDFLAANPDDDAQTAHRAKMLLDHIAGSARTRLGMSQPRNRERCRLTAAWPNHTPGLAGCTCDGGA